MLQPIGLGGKGTARGGWLYHSHVPILYNPPFNLPLPPFKFKTVQINK